MHTIPCSPEAEETLGLHHLYYLTDNLAAPLALFVHGRSGNCNVMAPFYRVIPEGWNALVVQAPIVDPDGGYSWWLMESNKGRFEDIASAASLLQHFLITSLRWYGLTPPQIFCIGFSQGAALLSLILQHAPHELTGVALLAGFVVEERTLALRSPHRPNVFMAHGIRDEIVEVERARKGRDYLLEQGFQVTYSEDDVGHKVGTSGMRALREWIVR